MANNLLILLHRPSNTALPIAKRMGVGWYAHQGLTKERMNAFFDAQEVEGQDDFELLIEHNEYVEDPVTRDKWTYQDFKLYRKES